MDDLTVNYRGGGSFVSQRPQFSPDSEKIYILWKNTVLCYSTKTGRLLTEFKGIKGRIVGFSVHFYHALECVTACSDSGEITTWNTNTHFELIDKRLNLPHIRTAHVVISKLDELKLLVSSVQFNRICFGLVDVNASKYCQEYELQCTKDRYSMDICKDQYFAVAQNNVLYVQEFDGKCFRHTIPPNRFFTCLACHQQNDVILTGDSSGRVTVWHNFLTPQAATQSEYHWHTLRVNCVSFSPEGSYFYSGGNEHVLVRWQTRNHFDRKFLPRLTAAIRQIDVAATNTYVAVASADNAIRILDSNFDQVSQIQHFVNGDRFDAGIVVDPRTKALVMNGNVGCVQFYSPCDKNLLYNVDVVGQNRMTDERNLKIENTHVIRVAMSKSGCWMASVEERVDLKYRSERRMKFWKFDSVEQIFYLNTSVEDPHETSINSILFQQLNNEDHLKCITVGDDRKFKVWQLTDATSTIENQVVVWKCSGIGFYRDLPCKSLALSIDGSLLAVGFGPIVTTWLPDSIELKCSLVHPDYHDQRIECVQFGRSNQCHLIVAATKKQLSVWNLLTLSMVWTVSLDVSLLIADTVTTLMAVITRKKEVFVFSPASSSPIYSSMELLIGHPKITAASFIPGKYCNDTNLKWYQRSKIYFIGSNKELFSINGVNDNDDDDSVELYQDDDETMTGKMSLFSMTIPSKSRTNLAQSDRVSHLFLKDDRFKVINKYFDAPIHTLMPIRFTCGSILRSFVLQKDPPPPPSSSTS